MIERESLCGVPAFSLGEARGYTERGGNGSKYRDYYLQNEFPRIVFHKGLKLKPTPFPSRREESWITLVARG